MHLWHRVIGKVKPPHPSGIVRPNEEPPIIRRGDRPAGPVVRDPQFRGRTYSWGTRPTGSSRVRMIICRKRRERTQRPSPCTRRRDRKPRWSGVGGGGRTVENEQNVYGAMDDELMIQSERAPTAHLIDTFQRHFTTILWLILLSLSMLSSSCLGVCVDDREPCVTRVRVTRYARTAVCREDAYARDNRRP